MSEAERNRLRMLQQQATERKVTLQQNAAEDNTYQYMSSASNTSRTKFTYHPYSTDQNTTITMQFNMEQGPPLTNSPCPAGAGSSASPVDAMATGNNPKLYFHNPTLSSEPHMEATVEMNEYDTNEEEYTVMSPGGTLTSQITVSTPHVPGGGGENGGGVGEGVDGNVDSATVAQTYSQSGGQTNQFGMVITTEC